MAKWRWAIVLAMGLALTGCSGEEPAAEPAEEAATSASPTEKTTEAEPTTETEPTPTVYPNFADVDPYLHSYFIALEETDTVDGHGERRTWGLGVRVCHRLDAGWTFDRIIANIAEDNVIDPGSLVAAAVSHICDQHMQAAREWVEANS